MTYQLIQAKTNGNDDLLLIIDGKVASRWAFDPADPALEQIGDLSNWSNQAASGTDLSDYQVDYEAGNYRLEILAQQSI